MRYFLDQDEAGHWYLVEVQHRDQWEQWLELDPEDEESWKPPPFARALDGHPLNLTFENPLPLPA